jgi:hypothetical protein
LANRAAAAAAAVVADTFTGPGSWRYWDDAAHNSRRMLSQNKFNSLESIDAANEGGHSGPDSWRGRLLRNAAPSTAVSTNSNKDIAAAASAAPNSLQERGSGGHHGGFGHGYGGGWGGGGGSYGPSSYYYGAGSASSRFDFGSMWAGGARKLQGERASLGVL